MTRAIKLSGHTSVRNSFRVTAVLLVAVLSFPGIAQSQVVFEGVDIEIEMKLNKSVGAGFGHLPSDRLRVTVVLAPVSNKMRFRGNTAQEFDAGGMVWTQGVVANNNTTGRIIFIGEGVQANAQNPNHSVRFEAEQYRILSGSPTGQPDPMKISKASVAEVDIDADTLNRQANNTDRPPSFLELEDQVEATDSGGMILPVLHQGALNPLPAGPLPKQVAFGLKKAWHASQPSTKVGEVWIDFPDSVMLYRPDDGIIGKRVWHDVNSDINESNAWRILTNENFTQPGFIKIAFRWTDSIRHKIDGENNLAASAKSEGPYGSQDWIRLLPDNASIFFIRQDNSEIPADVVNANDACLMVSKQVTTDNLPGTASFDGSPGTIAPDTFRLEVRGFDAGLNPPPKVRVDVMRGAGTKVSSNTYDTVEGDAMHPGIYRTTKHLRLVSTGADVLGDQTLRVRLGDTVRATAVSTTAGGAFKELKVARPPSEDGNKAIRTADVRYLRLNTVNPGTPGDQGAIEIDKASLWASDVWAQAGVKFKPTSSDMEVVTPVRNLLMVSYGAGGETVTGNGTVKVTVTDPNSNPAVSAEFEIDYTGNDSRASIAEELKDKIDAHQSFKAFRSFLDFTGGAGQQAVKAEFIVVNRAGDNVPDNIDFSNISVTANTNIDVEVPALNFSTQPGDLFTILENNALALNFEDGDSTTIEVIIIGEAAPAPNKKGVAYSSLNGPSEKGLWNVIIAKSEAVTPNGSGTATAAPQMTSAFTLAHELGHIILSPGVHVDGTPPNVMNSSTTASDAVAATKRLTQGQHDLARTRNGPGGETGLVVLQKK